MKRINKKTLVFTNNNSMTVSKSWIDTFSIYDNTLKCRYFFIDTHMFIDDDTRVLHEVDYKFGDIELSIKETLNLNRRNIKLQYKNKNVKHVSPDELVDCNHYLVYDDTVWCKVNDNLWEEV